MLRRHVLLVLLAPLAWSCPSTTKDSSPTVDTSETDTEPPPVDLDEDGFTVDDGDCDDANPDVHPNLAELCNGLDDNCNGVVDESFGDSDKDGVVDCLDTEECDGLDNDGDGLADEDFTDSDSDGIADCIGGEVCDGVDNDEDREIDEGYDLDGDGYVQCAVGDVPADCDDSSASIHPNGTETPGDSIDNDCDGMVDEGRWSEGDLVIVEIMNNPNAVSDAYGEWFEVYNASGEDLFLNGLQIQSEGDGEVHLIESDELVSLLVGESIVLGKEDDVRMNGTTPVTYQYTELILGNEADSLSLLADGITLDKVTWDDGLTMPDPTGASMSLDPWSYDATMNDLPDAWCDALTPWALATDRGTPETANALCANFDHDGDGYNGEEGDCDDADPTTYPGASEAGYTVDKDCDGYVQPVAVAEVDPATDPYTCESVTLDGSRSYDPDAGTMTYAWTLVSAPPDSTRTTADIHETTDVSPVFYPDVPGDYTFSLVVSEGPDTSDPSSVTVTISERGYNNPPTAVAGDDQSNAGTSTCSPASYSGTIYECEDCSDWAVSLSAASSSDPDGDVLTYSWTVVSGSASLSDSTASETTLTIDGPAATYGSTSSATVEVLLTVTDCPGESATDTVVFTYDCTGS